MLATLTRGLEVRVQLQFGGGGGRASEVLEWLEDNYPHTQPAVSAAPGLAVALSIPTDEEAVQGCWRERLIAATGPLDVALEIVSGCFADLRIAPQTVVSLHVTGR